MIKTSEAVPPFNLWTEAWITLERPDGQLERLGIEQTLLCASDYAAIYEQSPLVIVGIHRLLVAILQAALAPRRSTDLERLWQARQFPADKIRVFGTQYAYRFNLFSAQEPFLQSEDLPLHPDLKDKKSKPKSAANLMPEFPAGVNVTHYRHAMEDGQVFCPTCAAGGLAVMPAFATIGGPGLTASINGTPPIYVIPGGNTLYESLAASLLVPVSAFQPGTSVTQDHAWWTRNPAIVERSKKDIVDVGYLHGLTFTPRKIRLHPHRVDAHCTRCGQLCEWGVRTMVYDKGESRSKDAPLWQDPFVAYRAKGQGKPNPILLEEGKALWQEYAGLFLPLPESAKPEEKGPRLMRPAVLNQIAALELPDSYLYPFRCVAIRTRQAKVFEWVDADMRVPLRLLRDGARGQWIRTGIEFAQDCEKTIAGVFNGAFGGTSKEHKKYTSLKDQMVADYWGELAQPFISEFVPTMASEQWQAGYRCWLDTVVERARQAFDQAAERINAKAATFIQRARAEVRRDKQLNTKRKRYLKNTGIA